MRLFLYKGGKFMAQLNLGKVALTYDDLTELQKDELRGEQGFRGEPGTQYGTCSTASSTVAKVVTITDFELKEGVTVMVNFTNANTADNPTLNVSSTGDLAIMNGTEAVDKDLIESGKIYSFTYNGANWQITSSAGGDVAKPVTQVEYNALSEEEKNKGIYVITDAYADGIASNVGYSNTTSGLTATDVQGAIDEVDGKIDTIESEVDTLQTDVQTINSNLNKYISTSQFDISWTPNSFKPNNTIVSFTIASNVGANGSYVPIFTCAWYDSSIISGVWQFAITLDGVKRRYNISATTWSDWL